MPHQVDHKEFEDELQKIKEEKGVTDDNKLEADDLQKVVEYDTHHMPSTLPCVLLICLAECLFPNTTLCP